MENDDDSLLFLNSSEEKLILSDIDRDLFLEALANPPPPNKKFTEACQRGLMNIFAKDASVKAP